jgi:uncharacterized membrane protein YphA (DoxX/SURF4 family)
MQKQHIIFWIATTIIFLWEGLMPLSTLLFSPANVTYGTRTLGYPDYFAYALAICKVAGATAIMIPKLGNRLKEWAYAGLSFNLLFAVLSHIIIDKNPAYIALPLIIAAILAASYALHHKLHVAGTRPLAHS